MAQYFIPFRVTLVLGTLVLLASCSPPTATTGGGTVSGSPAAVISAADSGTVGSVHLLNGKASAGATSYAWTWFSRPSGSGAVLETPSSSVSSFVPDVAGSYTVQLAVSNGTGSDITTKTLLVGSIETPVVSANAPATSTVGQQITLNGSGTTGATSYAWTIRERPSGSMAAILNPLQSRAYFTPDLPGSYSFQLAATNSGGTATATATIVATAGTIAVTIY